MSHLENQTNVPILPYVGTAHKQINQVVSEAQFQREVTLLQINVSCQSSNLIYAITCSKSAKQYVGQTGRRLTGPVSRPLR